MNRRDFLKKNMQAVALVSAGAILAKTSLLPTKSAKANTLNNESSEKIKIGILLFDDVEVLDFAGPFEVFSIPFDGDYSNKIFEVITASETGEAIVATGGLRVIPDYSISDMPSVDVLIIPGGGGTSELANNMNIISWIEERSKEVEIMASVCTGAFLLAKAGLLDGRRVTTHIGLLDALEAEYPNCTVIRNVKFVDEEDIITSAGISAGIEMSFHLVEKLAGLDAARATAATMEYDIVLD